MDGQLMRALERFGDDGQFGDFKTTIDRVLSKRMKKEEKKQGKKKNTSSAKKPANDTQIQNHDRVESLMPLIMTTNFLDEDQKEAIEKLFSDGNEELAEICTDYLTNRNFEKFKNTVRYLAIKHLPEGGPKKYANVGDALEALKSRGEINVMEEGFFLNLYQVEDTHALAAWETYQALANLQDFGETIRIIQQVK